MSSEEVVRNMEDTNVDASRRVHTCPCTYLLWLDSFLFFFSLVLSSWRYQSGRGAAYIRVAVG